MQVSKSYVLDLGWDFLPDDSWCHKIEEPAADVRGRCSGPSWRVFFSWCHHARGSFPTSGPKSWPFPGTRTHTSTSQNRPSSALHWRSWGTQQSKMTCSERKRWGHVGNHHVLYLLCFLDQTVIEPELSVIWMYQLVYQSHLSEEHADLITLQIPLGRGFWRAVRDVVNSNTEMDFSSSTRSEPVYHFDSERIDGSIAMVREFWTQIVLSVRAKEYESARYSLGQMFHSLQVKTDPGSENWYNWADLLDPFQKCSCTLLCYNHILECFLVRYVIEQDKNFQLLWSGKNSLVCFICY